MPDDAQCAADEREMVYEWCRRLDLPLWNPPRMPEAIDELGREIERLRVELEAMTTAAAMYRAQGDALREGREECFGREEEA